MMYGRNPNNAALQAYMPEKAQEGFGYKDFQGVLHIRQSEANKVIAAYTVGGVLLGAIAIHFKMRKG